MARPFLEKLPYHVRKDHRELQRGAAKWVDKLRREDEKRFAQQLVGDWDWVNRVRRNTSVLLQLVISGSQRS
jgi:hypothetical protein